MNALCLKAVAARRAQLAAEYAEAREMVELGRVVPLNHLLRQSLARVAGEIQAAIDEGVVLTEDDLALLCATETKAQIEADAQNRARNHYGRHLYAHTLFEYSRRMLDGRLS